MVQKAPIHQSHVYGRIKILWTSFESAVSEKKIF